MDFEDFEVASGVEGLMGSLPGCSEVLPPWEVGFEVAGEPPPPWDACPEDWDAGVPQPDKARTAAKERQVKNLLRFIVKTFLPFNSN